MPVPLHQFLSPPFASILTPMSWPCRLGGIFLLGSQAAQDVNYLNYEEVMRCVSNPAAGENSSPRRHASGELPRRKIVYPIVTLITHTLSSIQGMQAHVHPTTIGSCFNQPIASTVVDTIASPTDSRGKYFMPLASTGATRSQQT